MLGAFGTFYLQIRKYFTLFFTLYFGPKNPNCEKSPNLSKIQQNMGFSPQKRHFTKKAFETHAKSPSFVFPSTHNAWHFHTKFESFFKIFTEKFTRKFTKNVFKNASEGESPKFNFFRKHPNASESVRVHPNASEQVRTGLNTSKWVRKLRKTCENFATVATI